MTSLEADILGASLSTADLANTTAECLSAKWKKLSRVQLLVTPWTIESMEFSRPEYWSG